MKFDEPFIAAHQSFWVLGDNPYPWLQDKAPIAFRYGYSALKRNCLTSIARTLLKLTWST